MHGARNHSAMTAEPVRIVIVDDHPVVRDGLVGMFASEACIEVVGEAADGREGLVVINETAPDVVLLDLRMPRGDGIEVLPYIPQSSADAVF